MWLVAVMGALVFAAVPQASTLDTSCSAAQEMLNGCTTATVNETDVTLGIDGTDPGTDSDTSTPDDASPPTPDDPFADCIYVLNDRCLVVGTTRTTPTQPVTWTDIATFSPTQGEAGMEPNGWAVIGLPTNFFASSAPHVQDGVLLGRPASVRFSPVSFHWDYGDGTSATLATAGSSWPELGAGEFGETPTSHVFQTSGNYTVTLTVEFAAEYQLADLPWTPIAGTIDIPAAPLTLTADTATTVLVGRECTINPGGPGC